MTGGQTVLLTALAVGLGLAARIGLHSFSVNCATGDGMFVAQCLVQQAGLLTAGAGLGGISVLLAAGAMASASRLAGAAFLAFGLAGWGAALGPDIAAVVQALFSGSLV